MLMYTESVFYVHNVFQCIRVVCSGSEVSVAIVGGSDVGIGSEGGGDGGCGW